LVNGFPQYTFTKKNVLHQKPVPGCEEWQNAGIPVEVPTSGTQLHRTKMQHLKIDIQGNLKGTGYMYFVKQIACLYGIKGYVKYEGDNSVIIYAEGKEESLKRFIKLSRVGTYNAHIDNYEIIEIPFNNFKTFEIQ
jgi:acylphosphatase